MLFTAKNVPFILPAESLKSQRFSSLGNSARTEFVPGVVTGAQTGLKTVCDPWASPLDRNGRSENLAPIMRRHCGCQPALPAAPRPPLLFECKSIPLYFISASVRSKCLSHLDSNPTASQGEDQAGYMIINAHAGDLDV